MKIDKLQNSCECQGNKNYGVSASGVLQELMKDLSSQDKVKIQTKMQELSPNEKKNVLNELSKLDDNLLNKDNSFDSIISLLNNRNNRNNEIEIYA